MKKIIKKISQAVQLVLMAPIKLPGKAKNILTYIAVGLGIMEKVIDKEEPQESQSEVGREEAGDEDAD